ncbi:hypothetical protein [Colwellia sp. E2M01]|uniref:hypothetical protein n=1 Tax=Colwellia sp. E2M01 TaxID=2841561 RepID=UPI001C092238|nr:hypothetical protein [Colwellia sp. E2M01]MBU2872063.1 hypothetical protein [Colwellia sp. E2M01]
MKVINVLKSSLLFWILIFSISVKSMDIELETTEVDSSVVKLRISNNTEKVHIMPLKFILENYYIRFVILNSKGERMRFFGKEIRYVTTPADFVAMDPKSSFEQVIDLKNPYALKNDIYKVHVVYEVLEGSRSEENLWYGKIESNSITIDMRLK